jgi:hypothetical protein
MRRNRYFQRTAAAIWPASILAAVTLCGVQAYADDAAAESKHQMMKDCMAKQKASESGRPKDEMKKSCKDVTKTEKQNADQAAAAPAETPHN